MLGKRIKELRVAKGLSQRQLAVDAGISKSYVGFIENGSKDPSVEVLDKIAKALEVELAELFRVKREMNLNDLINGVLQSGLIPDPTNVEDRLVKAFVKILNEEIEENKKS